MKNKKLENLLKKPHIRKQTKWMGLKKFQTVRILVRKPIVIQRARFLCQTASGEDLFLFNDTMHCILISHKFSIQISTFQSTMQANTPGWW